MELEELKAELSEAKQGIEALANKNKELLNELKAERKSNRESEVDSDKYYKLKDEFDDLSDKYKALEHTAKSKDKEIAKLTESNNGLNANLKNILIDDGLTNELVKAGVKKEYLEATRALLKGQVSLVDTNAMVGDKTLAEFIPSWAGENKHFITAPDNSGGGANGGNGGGASAEKKYFDKSSPDFNLTKQGEILKSNPALYAQLAK